MKKYLLAIISLFAVSCAFSNTVSQIKLYNSSSNVDIFIDSSGYGFVYATPDMTTTKYVLGNPITLRSKETVYLTVPPPPSDPPGLIFGGFVVLKLSANTITSSYNGTATSTTAGAPVTFNYTNDCSTGTGTPGESFGGISFNSSTYDTTVTNVACQKIN